MEEKDFFKELLGQQSVDERKVTIDFLREVWEYYDVNYLLPFIGIEDKGKVDFFKEIFLNPLLDATEEVAKEIGYRPSRHELERQFSIEDAQYCYADNDRPPF